MWIVIWFLGWIAWIASFAVVGLSGWLLVVIPFGAVVMVALSFAAVWWGLAPRDLFFTFVSEGHAKIVVKGGGAFDKILMVWKDHRFSADPDKEWEIEELRGAAQPGHGGLFLYGFWPWKRIKKTHFQWTNLLDSGEKKAYDEIVTEWRLMTQMYVFDLPLTKEGGASEDINGVPMGFDVVIPIRVINLYVGFFVFDTWLAMLNGTLKPIARRFVGRYRFKEDLIDMRAGTGIEELQKEKGVITADGRAEASPGEDLRDKLWQEIARALGQDPVLEVISSYGAELQKRGMDIINIDPDPSYREFTTARYQAERAAEVAKIKGGGVADEISERLAGPIVKTLAKLHGKNEAAIQAEIVAGQYSDEIAELREEARRREAIDAGQYREYNYPKGTASSNILDRAVDAFGNPMGGGVSAQPPSQQPTGQQPTGQTGRMSEAESLAYLKQLEAEVEGTSQSQRKQQGRRRRRRRK